MRVWLIGKGGWMYRVFIDEKSRWVGGGEVLKGRGVKM